MPLVALLRVFPRFFSSVRLWATILLLAGAIPAQGAIPDARLTIVHPVVAGQPVLAKVNASDPEGEPLNITIESFPTYGQLTNWDAATGEFTYLAPAVAPPQGRDSFTFRAWNQYGVSEAKKVYLTVLQPDGYVVRVDTSGTRLPLWGFRDVAAVAAGMDFTLALRTDGTVLFDGVGAGLEEVWNWTDIVSVAACGPYAVGLKADGTVMITGSDTLPQEVRGWTGVVAVAAGPFSLLGLKADGTVVAAGAFDAGQLDVGGLSDVMAVAGGEYHSIALKADGTVVAVGDPLRPEADTGTWTDVVAVAAGRWFTLGLKADGTVLSAGQPLLVDPTMESGIADWSGVVAIAGGVTRAVGIKADGSIVSARAPMELSIDLGGISGVRAAGVGRDHVALLIGPVAPVAANVDLFVEPGQPATTVNLAALSHDANGDSLSVSGYEPGAHGAVTSNGNGTLTYTPEADFIGEDSFHYNISDNVLDSVGTVQVHVSYDWDSDGVANFNDALPLDPSEFMDTDHDGIGNNADQDDDNDGIADGSDSAPLNARPSARLLNVRAVVVGDSAAGRLLATDVENDPVTYELLDQPAHGVVTLLDATAGSFTYTPDAAASGRDTFTYRVRDANGVSDPRTVHLLVRARGDSVVTVGDNGGASTASWRDVVQVSAGWRFTLGLKADGTVVANGENGSGQTNVSGWNDIVAVAAGNNEAVGLKRDGTLVAAGSNALGQLALGSWTDIAGVNTGVNTAGVRSDGTVLSAGLSGAGQLATSQWTDVVDAVIGNGMIVGLKADGTVVMAGTQVGFGDPRDWTDIVAISSHGNHVVGLKADGTVVAAGNNEKGQQNVSGWTNVVAVSAGWGHTLAMRADGSVLAIGDNTYGQLNVGNWSDLVAISAGAYHSAGLQRAGVSLPVFGLAAGDHEAGEEVTLTTATNGADVRYTLDGSDPTESSILYTAPLSFSAGTATIKARAFKAGWTASPVASATYTFYTPVAFNPGANNSFTLSGGSGSYNVTANANAYGATGTLVNNGGSYTFTPPTTGAFAGDYVIDAADAATGAVHHLTVTVPLRVTKERARLLSHDALRNDLEIQVRGTAPGTSLSLALDQAAAEAGLTVTATNGTAEDNASEGNPARFVVAAPDDLGAAITASLAASAPGVSGAGTLDAVAAVPHSGRVLNVIAEPVPGAVVTLLSAIGAASPLPWEDDLGRITATTAADGSFTLYAPPAGNDETQSLRVTALGYATVAENADNCTAAAPCTVSLAFEGNADAPVFTPAAGTYEQGVLVTLESSTVDATLRYTTDGSVPTRTSGVAVANGTGVQLNQSATVKAVAYKAGLGVSDVSEAAYVVVPANAASGLTATVVGAGEIDLAWADNSAKESGYRIYRATGAGSFDAVAMVGADITAYKDMGLAANTSYRYYVVAYVSGAESAQSNIVTANTATDTVAPTVLSVVPLAAATGVQLNKTITANFSEPINCSTVTTSSFTLKTAAGVAVAGSVACSGATATFTPSVVLRASTKYTARLTIAVKDLAGNALAAAKSWSFTTGTAKDTVKPTVVSTVPAAGASGVAVTQVVTATFSENLDCASVAASSATLSTGGLSVAANLSCSGKVVTLDPVALLAPNTAYTLTLGTGIRDLARNTLAAGYSAGFTTAP